MRTPGANPQWLTIPAPAARTIKAAVAWPDGPGPFPVIVVLHGTSGFTEAFVQIAQDLASNGFIAVAGCWFHGSHLRGGHTPPDLIDCPNGPQFKGVSLAATKDVTALLEAAKRLQGAHPDRLGIWGQSRGASMALVIASTAGNVQAVVAASAAYTEFPNPLEIPPIRFARDLNAPVLMLSGTADETVPVQQARDYEAVLLQLGKRYEAHYYAGAPHLMALRPPTREDALRRAVEFFKKHLSR